MRLALGTAQFGIEYGITNRRGKLREDEISKILSIAESRGVSGLDTAPAYGNSEALLGKFLPQEHTFSVVTKTPSVSGERNRQDDGVMAERTFMASLRALRAESAYGLLVHHSHSILAPDGERIFDVLQRLRDEGRVEKIGASVYDAEEIDLLLGRYEMDFIQVPLNVFDQRLVRSGHLRSLRSAGVEVHGRSLLLQGVLVTRPEELPSRFDHWQPELRAYRQAVQEAGITPMEMALGFARTQDIDWAIIGVAGVDELNEVLDAWSVPADEFDFAQFAVDDEGLVNPAMWCP